VRVRVAALLSGGKDSCYAVHVTEQWGWDVSHVVTVQPAGEDSMMFHWPNIHVTPLVARAMGKIGGARLAARAAGALPTVGLHWGQALLGQGGLALALALDYTQRGALPFPNIVFTAAIASVLLTDLSSAHLIRSVIARLTGSPEPPSESLPDTDTPLDPSPEVR